MYLYFTSAAQNSHPEADRAHILPPPPLSLRQCSDQFYGIQSYLERREVESNFFARK